MHALSGNFRERLASFVAARAARLSRRCYAFGARLAVGGTTVPRHIGSFAVVGLFTATAIFGITAGGHAPEVFKVTTSTFGFAVEKVNVVGNHQTSEIDVLGALGLDGDTSMVGFDVDEARKLLAQLPWIQSVTVQKVYPDRLNVTLVERKPIALWQHDGDIDVVDADGRVIVPFRPGLGRNLPLVVGRGAEVSASEFLAQMDRFPELKERIRAYIRIGDRRWDVLLDNGVRLKLPEVDVNRRLTEALDIDKREGLFSRDVLSIDLRLGDRVTVALSDDAMARRAKTVKELERQEKARKAGRV